MIKEVEQIVTTRRIMCDGCDKCIADEHKDPNKFSDEMYLSTCAMGDQHFCGRCFQYIKEWVNDRIIQFTTSDKFRPYIQERLTKEDKQKEPDIIDQLRMGKPQLNPGEY